MSPMMIGFCGLAGSGKSTAAAHLVAAHGFERVRFAGPLKAMMRALGCTAEEVDGTMKETPCDLLGGRTPRQAMQWLGTEWGREKISPDLWTRAWKHAAAGHCRVVSDDVRFPNEAALIRESGGLIVEIVSDVAGSISGGSHASERMGVVPDLTLPNSMTAAFFSDLDALILGESQSAGGA